MYFIKRAIKYLNNKRGRTILLGIIFLVIANFVLAGLLVQNASVKAKDNTRIAIGADISYIVNLEQLFLDYEKGLIDGDTVGDLKTRFGAGVVAMDVFAEKGGPTYANFMQVVNSQFVEDYSASILIDLYTDDFIPYTQEVNAPSTPGGIFNTKLYITDIPSDFSNGNSVLKEGRLASSNEVTNGDFVVVVEETFAELNNVKIGDNVPVYMSVLDLQDIVVEFEVIGIFESNEHLDQQSIAKGGGSFPQNRFYTPFNILRSIGVTNDEINNILLLNNEIALKDPLYVDEFKEEAASKVKLEYGNIDANDDLYNSLMGPIESLGQISKILVIIIAVAGASIIGLITALTVNDRKEEIGILLAVGESKLKIIMQFVLEVTLIAVIAFSFSSLTGGYLGKNISDKVLQSEILEEKNDYEYYDKGKGKDSKQYYDKKDEPKSIDINLSFTVLLQLYGLGILLSAVSTILPSLYVMRFNPKQILTNRNS